MESMNFHNDGCTEQSGTWAAAGRGGRQWVAAGGNNINTLSAQRRAAPHNLMILLPPTATPLFCASTIIKYKKYYLYKLAAGSSFLLLHWHNR
jgi:hypothetical protein